MLSMDFCHTTGNYAKVNKGTVQTYTEPKCDNKKDTSLINSNCPPSYGLDGKTPLSQGNITPLSQGNSEVNDLSSLTKTFSADEIFETPHASLSSLNKHLSKSKHSLANDLDTTQNSYDYKEDAPDCALLRKNSELISSDEQSRTKSDKSYLDKRNRIMSQVATYRNRRKSKFYFFKCCTQRKRGLGRNNFSEETSQTNDVQNSVIYADDVEFLHEEPLRKRMLRACFTLLYFLLASIAVIVTYSMVTELVYSMNNPVRSIHYKKNDIYDAPGIAVYPGGASLLACGHYYNNVVTSKVRLEDLDLVNRNCTYKSLDYVDPHYPNVSRNALIFRGPTSFKDREAVFLHFELEDETRDFFTVSYFVFPGFDPFLNSSAKDQANSIINYHRFVPTFALSSGLRMWIKLIMSETYFLDGTNHTDFKVEYSVVKFHDRRPAHLRKKKLFFIFFEWKNDITEQSYLLYTTTLWSMIAGLCGVFLTLHRGYQLGQTSYKRVQKDKQRRSTRKKKLEEYRKSRRSASGCDRYGNRGDVNL